jgi:signal transduction histidine kinase
MPAPTSPTPPPVQTRKHWNRSLGITIVTGLVLLIVLGLVFSVAYGSRRITTSAGSLHDADETLRVATVARAQLALAVHMGSVDREFGTYSGPAQELSITEAETALTEVRYGVEHLLAELDLDAAELRTAAERFVGDGTEVIADLETGNPLDAQRRAEASLSASFDELTEALVGVRDELSRSVAASDQQLGRIGNLARFLVAFLIPAAVIIVYRELVRRQQRQIELETRLEAERQINEARERFVANASHELRTPLTSIVGLAMVLAENEAVRSDAGASELLDIIIGESDDLSRMVEDLLTVARLDSGALQYTFEDVDLSSELTEITESLQRSGMDLTLRAEPGVVRVDRLRIRQVLRNLLSNAGKYGGSRIRLEGRVEGRTYACSVIDNGPGIPEELVPRLFQRFIHQGHETASKDSVGLGLSIVQALAQGMGGSVRYERIRNETHFTLRVPLAAEDGNRDARPIASTRGSTGGTSAGSFEIAASAPLDGDGGV